MSKLARACAVAVAVATSLAGGIAAAQIQGGVARKAAPPAVALGVPVAKANVGQRSSGSAASGSPLSFASGQPALRYQSADLPTAKDPVRREAIKDGAKEPNVSARGAAAVGTASATGEFAPAPGVLRANMPPVNRPSVIQENGSVNLASYAYDDLGRRTTVTLGNGTTVQRAYDNQGALATLKNFLASP